MQSNSFLNFSFNFSYHTTSGLITLLRPFFNFLLFRSLPSPVNCPVKLSPFFPSEFPRLSSTDTTDCICSVRSERTSCCVGIHMLSTYPQIVDKLWITCWKSCGFSHLTLKIILFYVRINSEWVYMHLWTGPHLFHRYAHRYTHV